MKSFFLKLSQLLTSFKKKDFCLSKIYDDDSSDHYLFFRDPMMKREGGTGDKPYMQIIRIQKGIKKYIWKYWYKKAQKDAVKSDEVWVFVLFFKLCRKKNLCQFSHSTERDNFTTMFNKAYLQVRQWEVVRVFVEQGRHPAALASSSPLFPLFPNRCSFTEIINKNYYCWFIWNAQSHWQVYVWCRRP